MQFKDLYLKDVNRELNPAVSADDKGVTIDVYDSDVMVLSIPVGGLSQGAAEKAVDKALEEF